jgi:septal ring factor EnvC (AmiA/AmiB activator)
MLVDKSKAARMAGVSRQTIHRKIASGELSATDGQIDTSELIRVFGDIKNPDDVSQDVSQPVSNPSQRNSNVQVQLQARIDTLETELAVTREQLRDTATDRDEWREMAKSANENVKLLTDQSGKGGDTNSNVILIAIAALIGVVLLVLGLTGNLGGSQRQESTAGAEQEQKNPRVAYYEGMLDMMRINKGEEPIHGNKKPISQDNELGVDTDGNGHVDQYQSESGRIINDVSDKF